MYLLNVLSDCSPAFNSCPGQCVRRNVYPLVSVFVCTAERGWNNKSNQSVSLRYAGVLQPGKCDTSRFTNHHSNRPFPSCAKPLFKTHFHKKRFALSLVLKVREFGTRKWSNNKIKLRGLAALFCFSFFFFDLSISLLIYSCPYSNNMEQIPSH